MALALRRSALEELPEGHAVTPSTVGLLEAGVAAWGPQGTGLRERGGSWPVVTTLPWANNP